MDTNYPENLIAWSFKMQGAREMLQAIVDCVQDNPQAKFNLEGGTDGIVYHKAIIALISKSPDNIQKFIMQKGRNIRYCNHTRNAKGKLISVDAYFA